ncbi:MAG: phosphate ABC transporter permease PstA [Nitrospiraceae bacterium]|nr:phosphate ABC transporter permease PstA [Nitrospira sp.]MCB9775290.1 phosphate ABC transporter permease PstA [Nitrospiraceae bacterium]
MKFFQRFFASGSLFIWLAGGALACSLLMIGGLLTIIFFNGMGYFWPKDLVQLTLKNDTRVLGEIVDTQRIPETVSADFPHGQSRIQLKVGNRDVYGLDFRWVDEADIAQRAWPQDVIAFERREWGNFYGWVTEVWDGETRLAQGREIEWDVWYPYLEQAEAHHQDIHHIERDVIGAINADMERARLNLKVLESKGKISQDSADMLQREIQQREAAYQEQIERLVGLYERLNRYRITLVDVTGEEKTFPFGGIVKAWRPNAMSVWDKTLMYVENFWNVLTDEPREANTEGGIFPAIFGTVMMVLVMSVVVVPFGVLAAVYLKEYAKQGLLTRMIRIAVNNLAGVPSIVFGVFGLGFFVYAVGGTIDQLLFSAALPNPTFGTGGMLWASLTLALMTVPVVIVATEEGLSAVPREYREGSLGLGATKFESLMRVVLPCAMPGILTGLILAVSRATGEVAPLMLTGVVKLAPALPVDSQFPFLHLDRKFMHLGFHIYDVGFQSPNVEAAKPMVYVTTLVLVLVVLLLNMTAIALRTRMRKRYAGASV